MRKTEAKRAFGISVKVASADEGDGRVVVRTRSGRFMRVSADQVTARPASEKLTPPRFHRYGR